MRKILVCFVPAFLALLANCGRKESDQTSHKAPESPYSETAAALANAVNRNDVEALRVLLGKGVNPNIVFLDGTTVLHAAAGMGKLECVRLLLKHGADPNILSPRGNALHFALYADRPDIVQLLLDNDADVDAKDSGGHTPLDRARENKLEQSTKLIEGAKNRE